MSFPSFIRSYIVSELATGLWYMHKNKAIENL